jgi:small-conductance mechanosensitive channel
MEDLYQYSIKTLILLAITLIIRYFSGKAVQRFLTKFDGDFKRKRVSIRIINLFLMIFFIVIFAAIWNIETKDLIVFFTSTITVIGIAFFANWSILSNITASLILYFNHPLNIGETLRIYDKEFDVEGELIDLSFFFMYVRSKEGFLITIPTSAVLNKTVIIKSNKEV